MIKLISNTTLNYNKEKISNSIGLVVHHESNWRDLKNYDRSQKLIYLLLTLSSLYKIVEEIFFDLNKILNGGVKEYSFFKNNAGELSGRNSFKQYGNSANKKYAIIAKTIGKKIEEMGDNADLPIQSALDKAQCIMFYIVKHKGELPPGFVMDRRIKKRALTPILINADHNITPDSKNNITPVGREKIRYFSQKTTMDWLKFFINENKELSTPPVTFGVFE